MIVKRELLGRRVAAEQIGCVPALVGDLPGDVLIRAHIRGLFEPFAARLALDSFLDDPNFEYMRVYVQNAYAVLVVPEVLKAGFFFGAEYGVGVLLVRNPQSGDWGQPAFYSVYGGSFGFQIGGSISDTVFTIMNEGAVDKLLDAVATAAPLLAKGEDDKYQAEVLRLAPAAKSGGRKSGEEGA